MKFQRYLFSMELNNFKNLIESTLTSEIRKYIISEAKNEKYHIMCDGEPVATFESMEKAEEELPKYQKNHPDKELIIEKGVYESYEDMIEKLDEMGEELEEIEANEMKNLEEKEQMCNECGGEMNEGECMECGYKMVNESNKKKKTIRLKESEFVKMLANIVSESVPGIEITKRAQSQSKKDNEAYASEVKSKMEKASTFDNNDNPEFPKQIGKGEKVARVNTEDEDEIVSDNRGGGLEDLNYEIEPSEMFKDRAKKAIVGHKTMGNSPEAANVVKNDLGEKITKKIERKKEKKKKEARISWGHAWKEPTDININESKDKSKKLLNEEIERIKNLTSYNKKTQ